MQIGKISFRIWSNRRDQAYYIGSAFSKVLTKIVHIVYMTEFQSSLNPFLNNFYCIISRVSLVVNRVFLFSIIQNQAVQLHLFLLDLNYSGFQFSLSVLKYFVGICQKCWQAFGLQSNYHLSSVSYFIYNFFIPNKVIYLSNCITYCDMIDYPLIIFKFSILIGILEIQNQFIVEICSSKYYRQYDIWRSRQNHGVYQIFFLVLQNFVDGMFSN